MNKIKIGITGINPFNGNRGVGALAISTLYMLDRIAKERGCIIETSTINSNYGKYSIDIGYKQVKINSILPISIFTLKDILRLITKPKLLISFAKYLKFDFILCMGEGDSFSDIYGTKRFNTINNQHRMARLLKKTYALLPQTIGPFNDNNAKKLAKKSIEKANLVSARDFKSYNYITTNTRQKKVFESIDVAFFMPYRKQVFSIDYIHVGINISSLLWHGGYTQDNQFGLKSDYKELIHKIIEHFLTIDNVKIHLIPHVVGQNSSIENDYEVSYHLVNEYNNCRIILAPFFLTPILAKNYIAGLNFFAGARMHSTIAAFSSGVPVFPIAYSCKFNGLFKDTLNYKYMGDMVNDEINTIIEEIKNAFYNRKELAAIIQTRMNTIVKEREKLLEEKLTQILGLTSK